MKKRGSCKSRDKDSKKSKRRGRERKICKGKKGIDKEIRNRDRGNRDNKDNCNKDRLKKKDWLSKLKMKERRQ